MEFGMCHQMDFVLRCIFFLTPLGCYGLDGYACFGLWALNDGLVGFCRSNVTRRVLEPGMRRCERATWEAVVVRWLICWNCLVACYQWRRILLMFGMSENIGLWDRRCL